MISTLLSLCTECFHFLVEFTRKNGKSLLTILIIAVAVCCIISISTAHITINNVNETLVSFRDTIRVDMEKSLLKYDQMRDSLRTQQDLDQIIKQQQMKNQLKVFRKDLNCDYLMIAQFHNSVKSIGGCPFIKFSITYNIYKEGLPSIDVDEYQNVPISRFDVVTESWDDHTSLFTVEELKNIDKSFYHSIKSYLPSVTKVVLKKLYVNNVEDGVAIYMFNEEQTPNLVQIDNYTSYISDLISR